MIKNPVLRDRLNALVVFTGIAIGGVSGVEMVIGGGFDTITPAFAFEASAPRAWYDQPTEPGMGWLYEPYVPAVAATTVSQQFGDGYPIEASYDDSSAGDLDGAPRSAAPSYARTSYQPDPSDDDSHALVSAADGPVDPATLDRMMSEAQSYADEINELYAEEHAGEIESRDASATETLQDIDPKLDGTASPS